MDLTRVTIRHLEIFRAVMDFGSSRTAARRLGITQSAVSQQLKQLEIATRTRLFDRAEYRLAPTDRAYKLYRLTDRLFHEISQIGSIVSEALGEDRFVTMAVPHAFSLYLLPRVIKSLSTAGDETVYRIGSCNYGDVVDRILAGQAQVGLARLPLDPERFEWKPLCSARSVCLLPVDHPLTKRQTVEVADLIGERLIAIDRQHASSAMGPNSLLFKAVEQQVAVYFDAIGYEAAFVAHGNGVAITNSFVASQCRIFGVASRPFNPSAIYEYVLAWPKGKTLSRKVLELVAAIEREVATEEI